MTDEFPQPPEAPSGGAGGGVFTYHTTVFVNSEMAGDRAVQLRRTTFLGELERTARYFVPPDGMNNAREILAEHRSVLVDGRPGTGRTTAARMLLYELPAPDPPFREPSFRELVPDEKAEVLLPEGIVGQGDRIVWDLSAASPTLWTRAREHLPFLFQEVRERLAYLVVVLPHAMASTLSRDLAAFVAPLAKPPFDQVLQRAFRVDGLPAQTTLKRSPAVTELLRQDPTMRDLARFTEYVRRSRDVAPDEGFDAWTAAALNAFRDWENEVADLARQAQDSTSHALLLAAGMLAPDMSRGLAGRDVWTAADLLVRMADPPAEEKPVLVRPDLAEQIRKIGGEYDRDGTVRFPKPDFDRAVRRYCWNQRPDLHGLIARWVERAVDLAELSSPARAQLAISLAEQRLRRCHPGDWPALARLIRRWAGSEQSWHQSLALLLTGMALQDETAGSFFRQQVYQWSTNSALDRGMVSLVRQVCVDVIADRHPDQAMVRLHHLARRNAEDDRIIAALLDLVERRLDFRTFMLARVARSLAEERYGKRAWEVDYRLFLRLADPEPLTASRPVGAPLIEDALVRRCLVSGWREVLRTRASQEWADQVAAWLTVAEADGEHRERLLDVLAEAAADDPAAPARLYHVARSRRTAGMFTAGVRSVGIADLFYRRIAARQEKGSASSRAAS